MDTSAIQYVSKEALHYLGDSKILISLVMGIGLSACCGFRVFVPLLIGGIAGKMGYLTVGHGFEWIGTMPALVAFGVATLLEIGGYYIPFVDNVLDTITTPASVMAGTLLTASTILPELDPMLKWGLAIIVGGGSAGIIQAGTALTRATSTATTAGVANPAVATIEHIFSIIGSILSLIIPFVIAGILCVLIVVILIFTIRYFKKHIPKTRPAAP
jgi:hypothetical protein